MSYPGHHATDCADYHQLVRDFEGDRPNIIVLCGSTRFKDEFARVNRAFTMTGAIVLAPGVFGHSGDPLADGVKARLDELHLRKIDLADAVFVVNPTSEEHPNGYIGESTRNEIAYARKHGKPVNYLTTPAKAGV